MLRFVLFSNRPRISTLEFFGTRSSYLMGMHFAGKNPREFPGPIFRDSPLRIRLTGRCVSGWKEGMRNERDLLQNAIRQIHGCDSSWVASIPIHETLRGTTVWKGYIELFDLANHPEARRCYAWKHDHGPNTSQTRFVVVLEGPSIRSAEAAFQCAILAQCQ